MKSASKTSRQAFCRSVGLPARFGKKLTGASCPRTFDLIMLRKTTQLFLLPFLFALLTVGGRTTLCEVLSVVGLESHHHAQNEAPVDAAPPLSGGP